MSEVLSVMSLEEVPIEYTGIAQFGGTRLQPYAVWVGGLICCYNHTLAQSEIDLAYEFKLLDQFGSSRDKRRANRA
jgi:GH24 family phage-related lysozyme (muramidase)